MELPIVIDCGDYNLDDNNIANLLVMIEKNMELPIVIDCRDYNLDDISIAKLLVMIERKTNGEIYNEYGRKIILNLPSNRFTSKTVKIIRDILLKQENIKYINLINNPVEMELPVAFIQEIEDEYLKKIILVGPKYLEEKRLTYMGFTSKQREILVKHHKKFYDKYFSLMTTLERCKNSESLSVEKIEKEKYGYYYCKRCYKCDLNKENLYYHKCKSEEIERKYSGLDIRKTTHNIIPSIDTLREIIRNLAKLTENKSKKLIKLEKMCSVAFRFKYSEKKISKYIYKELADKYITSLIKL